MPLGYPGSTPGVDPRSQGVIPRRFKRKKIFVTDKGRTHEAWTDKCDGGNSDVDASKNMNVEVNILSPKVIFFCFHSMLKILLLH